MKVIFRTPELAELDRSPRDLLTLFLFSDERPFRGLTGLADWRMNSRIARTVQDGHFSGDFGEVLLMPGYGRLPVKGVLLMGLGERSSFNILRFREAIQRHITTVLGIKAQRFSTSLPPWESLRMRPTQAIEFWVTELRGLLVGTGHSDLDILLYEPVEAQRAMMDTVLAFMRRFDGRG
jgi:hypothetical protein